MYTLTPIYDLSHILHRRDLYTQDISYVIGAHIYEYDMREAGFNLIKYYNLLSREEIEDLDMLPKDIRTIRIGMRMDDDPRFSKRLMESFANMRRKFFEVNNVDDVSILAIKKDAIYIVNHVCEHTTFKNVEFIVKNRYTSFHKFGKMEFYFRAMNRNLDIKGIVDEKCSWHDEYMLKFLTDIFHLLETSSNDRVISKLKQFVQKYKTGQLPIGFYRELNASSSFNLLLNEQHITSEVFIPGYEVDISFNYMHYLLPLIQRFFFIQQTI